MKVFKKSFLVYFTVFNLLNKTIEFFFFLLTLYYIMPIQNVFLNITESSIGAFVIFKKLSTLLF